MKHIGRFTLSVAAITTDWKASSGNVWTVPVGGGVQVAAVTGEMDLVAAQKAGILEMSCKLSHADMVRPSSVLPCPICHGPWLAVCRNKLSVLPVHVGPNLGQHQA